MSIFTLLSKKGPTGFSGADTAESVTKGLDLTGKTILLTGCNSGLGREALRVLTSRGARVIGLARTLEKAAEACRSAGNLAIPIACELSDPQGVRSAVAAVKALKVPLDAIMANAGIMALPKLKQAHGYELQFFTNHIGHFALIHGLLGLLTEKGRVVVMSSSAHRMAPKTGIEFGNLSGERGYGAWKHYGQSKLANLLFAKELNRRFAGSSKTAYAVHPGVIATNLGRNMNPAANLLFGLVGPVFLKTIPQGASTEVFAAVHPEAPHFAGRYLADNNPSTNSDLGDDAALAKRLWEASEEIVRKTGG
ncbi:MAG: SDR family NAD(P)-dependent oxidoreductase [Spirochaetes bacterium]|nr:SDR family NAD(P)-dependent oxidoreductase [Spirochaetota bacterium]